MNNLKKFKQLKNIMTKIIEILETDYFNNFNCISLLDKKIAELLKKIYILENEKEIDDFIIKTYTNSPYYKFITTNFTIIKFYLYWLHFCIQYKKKEVFNKLVLIYSSITYYRIFKNMLPYCDNIKLDFARKKQRKDSYFYNNETHYLLINNLVNSFLKKFSYTEKDIYPLLINITNTLRQSLRKLISTYIEIDTTDNTNFNQNEYINSEDLLNYIENSFNVIENELVEKISEKKKVNKNTVINILNNLNKEKNKILPILLNELNKNLILRKRNTLSSYYWSKFMIEKIKDNLEILKILKMNKIIKEKQYLYLYVIFEYFRNYILTYI